MQDKKIELRQQMKGRLGAMDDAWRVQASQSLIEIVVGSTFWKEAQVIALFAGRFDEIRTDFFWEGGFATGKKICYPKVCNEHLVFQPVQSPDALQKGVWELWEPTSGREVTPDLLIVPGMAFAADGRRLGRGRGYYDRYLTDNPEATALGVCFDFQLLPDIPTEAHDAMVNGVVTEKMISISNP